MQISRLAAAVALLSVAPSAALRAPALPARPTRRTALRGAIAFPLAFVGPLGAQAKCICKTVDDCVCTADEPAVKKKTARRLDAAGREVVASKTDRDELARELEEANKPEVTRRKAAPRKEQAVVAAPPPPPTFEQGAAERAIVPARSLGTQEFSEIDPNSA
eukprot:1580980-Prymnesium_polylepis.1